MLSWCADKIRYMCIGMRAVVKAAEVLCPLCSMIGYCFSPRCSPSLNILSHYSIVFSSIINDSIALLHYS